MKFFTTWIQSILGQIPQILRICVVFDLIKYQVCCGILQVFDSVFNKKVSSHEMSDGILTFY